MTQTIHVEDLIYSMIKCYNIHTHYHNSTHTVNVADIIFQKSYSLRINSACFFLHNLLFKINNHH